MLKLLLVLFFISLPGLAYEKKMDDQFFTGLGSPNIEILPKEHLNSYPFFSLSPYNIVGLRWAPDWSEYSLPESCSKNIIKTISDSDSISRLWQICEPLIHKNSIDQFDETSSMLSYDFDPLHHPLSREVIFHLPNHVKVRGILFLRSPKPHSLIIVRAGIFSSFNSMIAERFIFSQLFERGDYNLLIIPSTTGRQFIEDNDPYAFGGFEEGLHTLWIARELKKNNQPLSQLIQNIHTVGISMGASGVLAANLLNSIQKKNWIQRSIYFCPLLDFNSTLSNLKQKSIKTLLTSLWTGLRLEPLRKKYSISILEFFDYNNLVLRLTQNYKSPLIGWDEELLPKSAQSLSSFAEFNDFKTWLSYKNLTNPSLLFYSINDPIVPPQTNILSVRDQLPKNIIVLPMTRGLHCSVPANYNEAFMSLFVNNFLSMDEHSRLKKSIIWQLPIPNTNSNINNLTFSNIKLSENENLLVEIKNDTPFSNWHTEIEIPQSAINMYFESLIWNRDLKKSLKNWLEAHTKFKKTNMQTILQIEN